MEFPAASFQSKGLLQVTPARHEPFPAASLPALISAAHPQTGPYPLTLSSSPPHCGNARFSSIASAAHAPKYTDCATPCPL